jgi:hypothetical protein
MTTAEAFEKLRRRANRGDREAQQALKRFLNSNEFLWEQFGELARVAETAFVEFATDGDWLASTAVKRQAAKRRRELAGPSPTPLERMAVERVVACWQQLQHVQACCARSQKDLAWAKYWARREEQTHRMYDAALKALMLVRGLQVENKPSGAVHDHSDAVQDHGGAALQERVPHSQGHEHGCAEPALAGPKNRPASEAGRFNGHNRIAAFLEPVGLGVDG